jgi:HAE1 family hydrophobic/amphiphilic exporter-1
MRIWLNQIVMLAYKISSDEVMEALSESLEASPGKQEASGKRSQAFECIKYSGRFTTKEHWETLYITF